MIERTVISFLSSRLDVPVLPEYPTNPADRFVILHKGDSSRENMLDEALIVADSYGVSLLDAGQINEQVKAALDALPELSSISAAHRAGDYPAYDTKNKRHRYQAVYRVTYY